MPRIPVFTILFLALVLLAGYLGFSYWQHSSSQKGKTAFAILVTTETVTPVEIRNQVTALGTTTANEAVQISATVTAKVQSVHFNDGETIKKGDILVELDAAQQKADVEEQRVNLAEEQRQYDHLKKLIERKAISQTDVDKQKSVVQAARAKLEASQARLRDYSIRAPFTGVLGVRKVSVGTLVSPGSIITTLDDLSHVKVDFTLPETYLPFLHEGLEIEATSQTYPGKIFKGSIHFIDSRVDPVTRSVSIRADLPNVVSATKQAEPLLRPGMLVNVVIEQQPHNGIMVPERSIAPLRDDQFVFVVETDAEGNTLARKRKVQLGQRQDGFVEIVTGLNAGEQVVIDGSMSLQEGMKVTVQGAPTPAPN